MARVGIGWVRVRLSSYRLELVEGTRGGWMLIFTNTYHKVHVA